MLTIIGEIEYICEDSIVIKGEGNMILDLEKVVLFIEDEEIVEVLGEVEDVMGHITNPYYKVEVDAYLKNILN
jgi:rRNA processing protein Gar1